MIDLDLFADRDTVDPLYLDAPYYVYPDSEMAAEAFRVIGEARRENKVCIGRVTIDIEPRADGSGRAARSRAGNEQAAQC